MITEHLPKHFPNGHELRPGGAVIGWYPCRCAGTMGHRTQCCLECGVTAYIPAHTSTTPMGYPPNRG